MGWGWLDGVLTVKLGQYRARELLDKAIELGGKEVKPRALEDAGLEQLWRC